MMKYVRIFAFCLQVVLMKNVGYKLIDDLEKVHLLIYCLAPIELV